MDSKETRIYIALLTAGLIFLTVVIFFLITILRYKRKGITTYLDQMKADFSLLERERARMAADLHDELGSRLSAVKLMTDDFIPGDEIDKRLANKMVTAISSLMKSVRQLSNNMIPYALEREGLRQSLEELIETLFSGSSIRILTDLNIDDHNISKESGIHTYRIIQELLSNVIKHARASEISISLKKDNGKIQLQLSDNGISFDQEEVKKSSRGLGLRNIIARVTVLLGSIYLTTIPGKGTMYSIEFPAF